MMRKEQERELFIKITLAVADKIYYLREIEKWRMSEIEETSGLTLSRLSEIKNYKQYKKPISLPDLKRVLEGQIITVDELLKIDNLYDDEKDYIEKLRMYEYKNDLEVMTKELNDKKLLKKWFMMGKDLIESK